MVAARANVAAADARLSRLKRELSPASCPTVTAPKVFKLTGMSAADVGSMASQVSQESIGAMYWDANQLGMGITVRYGASMARIEWNRA